MKGTTTRQTIPWPGNTVVTLTITKITAMMRTVFAQCWLAAQLVDSSESSPASGAAEALNTRSSWETFVRVTRDQNFYALLISVVLKQMYS